MWRGTDNLAEEDGALSGSRDGESVAHRITTGHGNVSRATVTCDKFCLVFCTIS